MPARITLDISPYSSIKVIAVCAPMRDYRFIWHVNNNLHLSFVQEAPFSWPQKKLKQTFEYSIFRCPETDDVLVMNNRNENVQMIPTLSTIDYFVVFSERPEDSEFDNWMLQLRSIQGVTLVTELVAKNLEEFRNILSEMEFQDMQRRKDEKGKPNAY